MTIIDQMRVLLREHRERAEDRKAAIKPDPPHVTVPESLCRSTELASWMAYFALVYFLWLYTLDISRDRAAALHLTHLGQWVGDVQFFFPYIVGFAVVAVGIPYVAKIAIPTFTRLSWSEAPTEKAWALFIAVAVSAVVIAGTFTVQGDTILERDRDAAVAVENVQRETQARQGNVAAIQHELDMLCAPSNQRPTYQQQACRAGEASWTQRAAEARRQGDYQAAAIERSIPDGKRGDELRAELRTATRDAFTAAPAVASVERRVSGESNGWIVSTLGWLEGARAMLLSFVMDIVCLIMPLIALRLRLKRNQQLGAEGLRGWTERDEQMIADLRAEDPLPTQPMQPPKEVVRDAETGEELQKVVVKPYWRKKKGKAQRIEPDVMAMADETGVPDGGARAGSSHQDTHIVAADGSEVEPESSDDIPEIPSEPPTPSAELDGLTVAVPIDDDVHAPAPDDLTAEQIDLYYPELATEATIPLGSDGSDGVMHSDEETEEPPVAPRALIAAE